MSAVLSLPARVTHAEAPALAQTWLAQVRAASGALCLDASALVRFDTSALALLLACQREAQARGVTLQVQGLPERAQALARVYGVAGLLSH